MRKLNKKKIYFSMIWSFLTRLNRNSILCNPTLFLKVRKKELDTQIDYLLIKTHLNSNLIIFEIQILDTQMQIKY